MLLLFALKGEEKTMDSIQLIAKDTMHFCLGLLGVCYLYLVSTTIKDLIEKGVNWVGNKIDSHRQVKTR